MGYYLPTLEIRHPLGNRGQHLSDRDLLGEAKSLIDKLEKNMENVDRRYYPGNAVYSALKKIVDRKNWTDDNLAHFRGVADSVPRRLADYVPLKENLSAEEFSGLLNIMARIKPSVAEDIKVRMESGEGK